MATESINQRINQLNNQS